jgi:hypothetical protein
MFPITNGMLFVGALTIILCVGLAASSFLRNRRGKAAPFRDYFGPEYDRCLLRDSSFSEVKDWLAGRSSRFTPFHSRDPRD